jgi:heavy metal sensor kinase
MLLERARSVADFVNLELNEPGVRIADELGEFFHAYPPGTFLLVRQNRSVLFSSVDPFPFQPDPNAQPQLSRVQWHNHPYRLLNQRIELGGHPGQVVIASPLDTLEELMGRLRFLLIALIPVVLITASAGGTWLSRRALKPVDAITQAARSIGINNLSDRLIVPETGDELQRLSETWNSMLSRLEGAVTRLSRFTADASHELRTPLAVIRTTAEIAVRKSRSAESYRHALGQIVTESERMTQLVDDLLFLARCDAEAVEMPMAALDLGAIVEDLHVQMKPLAEAKRIDLACHVPKKSLPITGNDLAIRRLILVLLDNAIKYSPMERVVNVELSERDDQACLEITDHGSGIATSDLDHIFDRFYRVSDARSQANGGTGLGLSLAAGIAQRHHARIEVQSVLGQGSTFRVLLPLALPAGSDATAPLIAKQA